MRQDHRRKPEVDDSTLLFAEFLKASVLVNDDEEDTPPSPDMPEAMLAQRKREAEFELQRTFIYITVVPVGAQQLIVCRCFFVVRFSVGDSML